MAKTYQFLENTLQQMERAKFVECPTDSDTLAVRTHICQNPDETIAVRVEGTVTGDITPIYSATASLAGNTTGTILTYVVPPLKTLALEIVSCSGENVSKYTLKIDGATIAVKRSWWTNFNVDFQMARVKAIAGQTITIDVSNDSNTVADYDATLLGELYE